MSSNDILIISKSTFKVYHCDFDYLADTGDKGRPIGQGKSLEEAIKIAENWGRQDAEDGGYGGSEYGINFIE